MFTAQFHEGSHDDREVETRGAPGKRTLTGSLPARSGAPRTVAQAVAPALASAPDRLPAEVQHQMGQAFGLHLAEVPVDRDSAFAVGLGADAVAHDGRLHFAPGMYDPQSTSGLELIGHEVAHLAQQTDGRAEAAQAKGAGESPALEAEADALGTRAARGEVGLLGDGTLRSPARSGAVQRRPTRWDDIQENGVGVMWAPHKTAASGDADQNGQARGRGARVDGAPPPTIQYAPATASGGRGVVATNLGRQLPPGGPPAVDPAATYNHQHLGYVNTQLLPANVGGIDGIHNVIALPPDGANSLHRIHQAIHALTQNGFVNIRITVDEAHDLGLAYASVVRARWAQAAPDGTDVPNTVGEYTANLRSPSQVAAAVGRSSLQATLTPGPNQALAVLPPAQAPGARRAELTTTIDFGAVTADGDGTRMHARALGPDHGIGEQPLSGQVWGQRTRALELASNDRMKYVAGHLLNHHIGGPGNDARNLTPIPDDVNHEHEAQVETHVKALVRAGQWVTYDVTVTHSADPVAPVSYPSRLDCQWAQLDSAGQPIAATQKRVDLPISAPSTYGGAPIPPGKKLPKLATSHVVHDGPDAANPVGARTTLGFDEVLLEDTGTLGPQIRVMKPLVEALTAFGLHGHFQHNGALAQDVFHAMAAVKPTVEECEARTAVEARTLELRALAAADDVTGAEEVIVDLRARLRAFGDATAERAAASYDAARTILGRRYAEDRADTFANLIGQAGDRAGEDFAVVQRSAEATIDFAQRMLYQRRQVADLHEHPMSPTQALETNYVEAQYNDEDRPSVIDGIGARAEMMRRRLGNPDTALFAPPQRHHGDDRLLATIAALRQQGGLWPQVAHSGLSPAAQQVGLAIEALIGGAPGAAVEMVVRSLYQTNTVAFNQYEAWLTSQLHGGASSSAAGMAYDDIPPGDDDL